MFEFLHDQIIEGSISIDDDLTEELKANYALLSDARLNMEGENYSRLIINSSLPIESNQTFEFLNKVYDEASQYYDLASVYIVGESSNALDLSLTFDKDNIIISILSVAFVIIVLIITFRSIGLSILLIACLLYTS